MSGAVITRDHPLDTYRTLVGSLFAVHRRVVVRTVIGADADTDATGTNVDGPEFCTCGDVWPCRSEDAAARILDWS